MDYDAILFDMDGVLLTGEHTPDAVYRRAIDEMLTDFDVAPDVEGIPETIVRPDTAAEFRAGCRELDVPPAPAWGYREHAATVLENARIEAGEREPHDDATVIGRLAKTHEVGVVSNNRSGTVSFVLGQFGWAEFVDAHRGRIPSLADYDRKKPDPHYLREVLVTLDAGPDTTLFVGDRRSDVETARRAGVDAALLIRGTPPDGDAPEADIRLDTLHELVEVVD